MSLEDFSNRVKHYCRLTANSRKTLAHELGMHPSLLSHKLKGSDHRTLTHAEVKTIIKILAKWEAISSQDEALELLVLVKCPAFTRQEWRTPPLNQLETSRLSQPNTTVNPSSVNWGGVKLPKVNRTSISGYQPAFSHPKHNLPSQLSSFIGRETEKTEVKRLLGNTRLLTLTGAGGVGKTRLVLEIGAEIQASFEDGVWLVELVALTDPNFLVQAVGEVFGVREERAGALLPALIGYLRDKSLLLVLDNCEHLLSATSQLLQSLLAACPSLCILATSRQCFDIAGELNYVVPSLSLPPRNLNYSYSLQEEPELRQTLSQYEATELFIQRAQAAQPHFEISIHNVSTTVQICRQLDGIPLALELAASKVRGLTLEQIATLLSDRFRLLTDNHQRTIPRQQTLQASLDWSYNLLSAREQVVLRRLSILRGSWNLAGAEAICASSEGGLEMNIEEGEVLELLLQLVNKSLVVVEQPQAKQSGQSEGSLAVGISLYSQEVRYRLLESVREYALKKLTERDEVVPVKGRHLDYFLELAEETDVQMTRGKEREVGLEKLEVENDNLRAALGWAFDHEQWEKALKLGGALSHYWRNRGQSEGRHWLEFGLAHGDREAVSGAVWAKALYVAGTLAEYQGDHEAARFHHERCLALRRELGIKRDLAYVLLHLSYTVEMLGEIERATTLGEESVGLFREVGDKHGIAQYNDDRARKLFDQGDHIEAERLIKESLKLSRELGSKELIGWELWWLGLFASIKREVRVKAFYEKSLALRLELGNKSGISNCLLMLGEIELFQGNYVKAKRLLEESLMLGREVGIIPGWIIHIYNDLGFLEFFQGNYVGAVNFFAPSLRESREQGNIRQLVKSLVGLASLSVELGQGRRAARLFGAATALRERKFFLVSVIEVKTYDKLLRKAQAMLDEATFREAWEEGWAIELSEAIEDALELEFEFE